MDATRPDEPDATPIRKWVAGVVTKRLRLADDGAADRPGVRRHGVWLHEATSLIPRIRSAAAEAASAVPLGRAQPPYLDVRARRDAPQRRVRRLCAVVGRHLVRRPRRHADREPSRFRRIPERCVANLRAVADRHAHDHRRAFADRPAHGH